MPHYLIKREPIPLGSRTVPCQYDWRDGCSEPATWLVACGPSIGYFCRSHEGPPCGGLFIGEFTVTPETTRDDMVSVRRCGAHLIRSASDRNIQDLFCCACGEWIGDMQDPEIRHVSLPLESECRPMRDRDKRNLKCRACEELETLASHWALENSGGITRSHSDLSR